MNDETATGSSGAPDGGGHRQGGGGELSPFQARAAFLANWNWLSIVSINQRTCARGGAQHGINSETGTAREAEWEQTRRREITLAETIDFLPACHRGAPFLFYILDDGRVRWRSDTGTEFLALPESLVPDD